MAHLVGFIANRPDLASRVVAAEGWPLPGGGAPRSYGVGFHQSGDVLLRRRPADERASSTLADIAGDLRTDLFVARVGAAMRTADATPPHRYRGWLFAQAGSVACFPAIRERLRAALPPFLARDVRGESDAELLFHLFLSFLHDVGALDLREVDAAPTREALRATLSLVDRVAAEEGGGASSVNVMLARADHLFAVSAGATMGYRVLTGSDDMGRILGGGGLGWLRLPDFASARAALLAAGFDGDALPDGFTTVPPRAIVTVGRTDGPHLEPL